MDNSEELEIIDVNTTDGPIYGYFDKGENSFRYVFKKIPFAKPPVGPLRFMPPSPVKAWTERLNCTQDPEPPYHYDKIEKKLYGSEDCLYIEVISPDITPTEPLPVMFWLGTFGFSSYFDNFLDASLLIKQGIVFVRCGFRLGPFGFLSINDFAAPGNNGLKDVVLAMKWVQKNIHVFGGDKDNVTLFGSSSGGAIVHLMMLSPMATGLFHKAIIQSASALNSWSLTKNPRHAAIELAKELGITRECNTELVEELRALPAAKIMKSFEKMILQFELNENGLFNNIFKPCIEEEFEGQTMFLTKSPYLILKSGNFNKVPIIIGSTNTEAAFMTFFVKDFYNFELINKNSNLLVPNELAGETKILKDIGHQLIKFYLGGEEVLTENTKNQYIQLISDYYFLFYVHKTVRLHVEYALEYPVYYYVLNYCAEWTVPKDFVFVNTLGHCSELPLLFDLKLPGVTHVKGSRDSITTRNRVLKMWTNFAKFGNPTPIEDDLLTVQWDPVESSDKLNYLCIGSELTKGKNPFQERMRFWDNLHKEHKFLRAIAYFNDLGVRI